MQAGGHSLSGFECNLVVLLIVVSVDGFEVEGLREEVVYEGAERRSVRPARGKVLDLDALRKKLAISKKVENKGFLFLCGCTTPRWP